MSAVAGRYPLATGISSAKNWAGVDGVPRPDKTTWWLRFYSTALGFLGADHFYLRSPLTGLLKGVTLGGFLLWYLWDVAQVWSEMDRVAMYGMSLPMDSYLGVGQGQIYDTRKAGSGETQYAAQSSYSLWWLGNVFGCLGLNSLVTGEYAKAFRQCIEFLFFAIAFYFFIHSLLNISIIGLIFSFIIFFIFSLLVISQYLLSLGLSSDPERLETNANSIVDKLIHWCRFEDKDKKQILKHLDYRNISPKGLQIMFNILHKSEEKVIMATASTSNDEYTAFGALFWLIASPFYDIAINIWDIIKVFPPFSGIAMGATGASLLSSGKLPTNPLDIAGKFAKDLPNPLAAAGKLATDLPTNPLAASAGLASALPASAAATASALPASSALSAVKGIGESAAANLKKALGSKTKRIFPPGPVREFVPPKIGGAAPPETLSTESKLAGVVIAAIAGGGALKALIDYLVADAE